MVHGAIFACFGDDLKIVFHELRTKIDDTLVTTSGCIVITCFDDDLRTVIPNLKVAFNGEQIVIYYTKVRDIAWIIVYFKGLL